MSAFDPLFKGLIAGVAIAAPVGPVNVLCISRTLEKGWMSGLVSGFGAATADTLYGAIAGFSISFIINFLIREEFWIRLVGGMLLILIGIVYLFFRRGASLAEKGGDAGHSDFVSTLLLNLTNPTTILSFLAVLAALGLGQHKPWWMNSFVVAGIFGGSMFWWILLISVVNRFRDRFTDSSMRWMNRIAGLAIGAFGIVTLVLARGARH